MLNWLKEKAREFTACQHHYKYMDKNGCAVNYDHFTGVLICEHCGVRKKQYSI